MQWPQQQNVQLFWFLMAAVVYLSQGANDQKQQTVPPPHGGAAGGYTSVRHHSSTYASGSATGGTTAGRRYVGGVGSGSSGGAPPPPPPPGQGSSGHPSALESRSSYAMLSAAMSQAVHHEMNYPGSGAPDGACAVDDLDCFSGRHDRVELEAIRSLHRQLDDDDNGNIDIAESDDFLREELKYDSGYEKRHRAFHYNDDMHISVKELWEAWLRSEVHNWTAEQTTEWLAQSVQLPQYVDLFKQHKVTGATLPQLAVNNMHYVSTVLGIKDPIHKQKIALKAMDAVLFGPPRETGTRWKDYFLVALLLSAIIGCWYAYQQNKNAKRHLRRMAQDMEGLQKAENALQEMQKELERARLAQENVATEKQDLERRLNEAPSLTSSSSELELQELKQEIEMLRSELSRAEVELVDHCWSPPQGLQSWLQYTYELESKNHLKKRISAEKQLQVAREACEKLRRKRSSLVGAFVSTHGKSIDDVDRSIVEARNSLSEVTTELQERMHRWKQMEQLLGFSIVNNNGLVFLESILYNRNGVGKSSRSRITSSQDDLDDDSIQGLMFDGGFSVGRCREDSSASDDGDSQSVTFVVGAGPLGGGNNIATPTSMSASGPSLQFSGAGSSTAGQTQQQQQQQQQFVSSESIDDIRQLGGAIMLRPKKPPIQAPSAIIGGRAPMPPPRRTTSHQSLSGQQIIIRASSADMVTVDTSPAIVSSTTMLLDNRLSGQSLLQQSTSNVASATPTPTATAANTIATISSTTQSQSQDDTCSTDSSSFNDDECKRRRRRLHFPFGKKSGSSWVGNGSSTKKTSSGTAKHS